MGGYRHMHAGNVLFTLSRLCIKMIGLQKHVLSFGEGMSF